KLSDLKPGQVVSVGARVLELSQTPKIEADLIFIDRRVRELFDASDAAAIAREVDFASEYLVFFRWTGWSGYARDRLSFTVKEQQGGPVVVCQFTRPDRKAGMAKVVQVAESRLYVFARNVRHSGGPPGDAVKITSPEELAKAFPAAK